MSTCALDQLLQLQEILCGLLNARSNATGALAKFRALLNVCMRLCGSRDGRTTACRRQCPLPEQGGVARCCRADCTDQDRQRSDTMRSEATDVPRSFQMTYRHCCTRMTRWKRSACHKASRIRVRVAQREVGKQGRLEGA